MELLIGLLATACPPEGEKAWRAWRDDPPDGAELAAAFAPLVPAFSLDGDGPRFMQDFEDFAGEPNGAGTLLIEAPGENTVKRNTDLMVRRGRVSVLSRAAAAMALFTLQTYAPSGGAGNRTSLRGGGPLTNLALPPPRAGERDATLWQVLWANVPAGDPPDIADLPRVFPWLRPTRMSDKGARATTPADVHPLQAFWAAPRRIRLEFDDAEVVCDLTGRADSRIVRGWRQRPWGANYTNWGGVHPLSPCYRMKPGAELLYLHPQPGGIRYRHWLSVLAVHPDPTRQIAPAVATFRERRARGSAWRMLAGGFDMDNMKARGFAESEIPVFEPADPDAAAAQDDLVSGLVRAADLVARLLSRCVGRALFGDGAKVDSDSALLAAVRERFWDATANDFFEATRTAAAGGDPAAVREAWRAAIGRAAHGLFAEAAPMDASGEGHPARIAAAARQLGFALRGYGKDGAAIFAALALEAPPTAVKTRKGKAA